MRRSPPQRYLLTSLSCLMTLSWAGVALACLPVVELDSESLPGAIAASPIQPIAQSITVKLWVANNNWGSGVLIAHQNHTYTVLTNRHVLTAGTEYHVETSDGQRYGAIALHNHAFGQHDLGLLQFSSPGSYPLADLANESLNLDDWVMAAGYPIEDDPSQEPGFTTVVGRVELLIPQTMAGGYQIGTDLAIAKGMSGGPLLNCHGQVVGLNGLHQYPLWGNPYIFDDGSLPSATLLDQMQRYSWSIPMTVILPFLT